MPVISQPSTGCSGLTWNGQSRAACRDLSWVCAMTTIPRPYAGVYYATMRGSASAGQERVPGKEVASIGYLWIFANAGSCAKIGAKVGIRWPQSVLQSEKSLGQKLRRKFKINRLREDDMPAARHAICRMTLGILSAALVTSIWIGAAP